MAPHLPGSPELVEALPRCACERVHGTPLGLGYALLMYRDAPRSKALADAGLVVGKRHSRARETTGGAHGDAPSPASLTRGTLSRDSGRGFIAMASQPKRCGYSAAKRVTLAQ